MIQLFISIQFIDHAQNQFFFNVFDRDNPCIGTKMFKQTDFEHVPRLVYKYDTCLNNQKYILYAYKIHMATGISNKEEYYFLPSQIINLST